MRYDIAEKTAGELFGHILLRNADKEGFSYALGRLCGGETPLRLSQEMLCSDEFALKFLADLPAREISRKLTFAICGWEPASTDVDQDAIRIVKSGIPAFVADLIAKRALYFKPEQIPSMKGIFG